MRRARAVRPARDRSGDHAHDLHARAAGKVRRLRRGDQRGRPRPDPLVQTRALRGRAVGGATGHRQPDLGQPARRVRAQLHPDQRSRRRSQWAAQLRGQRLVREQSVGGRRRSGGEPPTDRSPEPDLRSLRNRRDQAGRPVRESDARQVHPSGCRPFRRHAQHPGRTGHHGAGAAGRGRGVRPRRDPPTQPRRPTAGRESRLSRTTGRRTHAARRPGRHLVQPVLRPPSRGLRRVHAGEDRSQAGPASGQLPPSPAGARCGPPGPLSGHDRQLLQKPRRGMGMGDRSGRAGTLCGPPPDEPHPLGAPDLEPRPGRPTQQQNAVGPGSAPQHALQGRRDP